MNRKNSNDGENYNPQRPTTDQGRLNSHKGYEIGEILVYGCEDNSGNFRIKNRNDFSVKYKITEDINDLPIVNEGTGLVKVNHDSATSVHGTNINATVGMGAYWVRVTYTDGSQAEFNAVDFMRQKGKGSIIELLPNDKLNAHKSLQKIEIVVAYEILCSGPRLITWWKDCVNWRCERTFYVS